MISIRGRLFRLIPFIILVLILLFCFLLIVNACYKYHLETEERRQLLKTVKCDKCCLLLKEKPVEELKNLVEEIQKPVEEVKIEDIYETTLKIEDADIKNPKLVPEKFKKSVEKFMQELKSKNFNKDDYGYTKEQDEKLVLEKNGNYKSYFKMRKDQHSTTFFRIDFDSNKPYSFKILDESKPYYGDLKDKPVKKDVSFADSNHEKYYT